MTGMTATRRIGERKPRLLTLKQAAGLIVGLTEYRLREMCIKGEIKHYKFGTKYMVSERDVLSYFGEDA